MIVISPCIWLFVINIKPKKWVEASQTNLSTPNVRAKDLKRRKMVSKYIAYWIFSLKNLDLKD